MYYIILRKVFPMNKLKELSVFFPAYNEEGNIKDTVSKALSFLPDISETFEVIIVNDGSIDGTPRVAGELAAEFPQVRLVNHDHNRGYGAAVRTGFSESRYGYIFFTDGDGQFDIRELRDFLPLISECDIVAGYRIRRNDPFYRLINAKAYNLLVRLLFGLKVRDIDCAFKIIRKKVVDSLELKSESQFVSAEFLVKARKKGFTIKQKGAHHFPRKEGAPTGNSISAIVNSFRELFALRGELSRKENNENSQGLRK
ncbi:MAG: glycosyltransferase [Candidatus Omnitrophica bacterium]|nr:glycosyltransferase [Candidatus Omnitrophota bacterium]